MSAGGHPRVDGVEVRVSGPNEAEQWLDVMADAVAAPDTQGVPSHEEFPRDVVIGAMRDLSLTAGALRGARRRGCRRRSQLRSSDGIAQFTGAATLPRYRRRESSRRCSRPGSPMPRRPGATWESSPRSRGRDLSRTSSAAASTCCTPARSWSRTHRYRGDFRIEVFEAYLPLGRILVARADEEIVGYLQIVNAEIRNMAVLPRYQGHGVGRALVEAAVELLEGTVVVATAAADVGSLRFYQRCGFRLRSVERDAFTADTGYPERVVIDGIELRDRVWLDLTVGRAR